MRGAVRQQSAGWSCYWELICLLNLPCFCKKANILLASLLTSACAESTGLFGASDKRCRVEATVVAGLKPLDMLLCTGFDPNDTGTARPKYCTAYIYVGWTYTNGPAQCGHREGTAYLQDQSSFASGHAEDAVRTCTGYYYSHQQQVDCRALPVQNFTERPSGSLLSWHTLCAPLEQTLCTSVLTRQSVLDYAICVSC